MPIIISSTMSNSGKSTIVSGLLKLLNGIPLKVQNMSLNSYPTYDGGEIAFIQAYQAIGVGLKPERFHNPILLKPAPGGSEVIFLGEPLGIYSSQEYYDFLKKRITNNFLKDIIKENTIIEGAGGLAEPNFLDKDVSNIYVSKEFNIPIILVLDIDRGGAFASAYGAYLILPPSVRANLKGFIINKFRGDFRLLEPAIKWLEEKTQMKFLGYLNYYDEELIMPEDSMNIADFSGYGDKLVSIVNYPYISNFNEFYALRFSNAEVRFIKKPSQLHGSDLVILPGSRSTYESLAWLKEHGFIEYLRSGKFNVLGICGGFQILGKKLFDNYGLESGEPRIYEGLGVFDINTYYDKDKIVSNSQGISSLGEIKGYEIRRGRIYYGATKPLLIITRRNDVDVEIPDGAVSDNGKIVGYSIHGSLFSNFGIKVLEMFDIKLKSIKFENVIDKQVEKVSKLLRENINVEYIRDLL